MADEPHFYADGLTVRARPVETRHPDGSTSSTMGFIVCTCSDYVDGAAEEIAKALNGVAYWREGAKLIQACLDKAAKADPLDAPIPLTGESARLWHDAQMNAYRHALEMMGPPTDA